MGAEDFLKIINNARSMDGKVIGEDGDFIKKDMGKDDKDAWIKHMVEQKLEHKKMDTPPSDLGIVVEDLMNEFVRKEIVKMFSKE